LIGAIEILPQLFGEVVIPQAVPTELRHRSSGVSARFHDASPDWLRIAHAPVTSIEGDQDGPAVRKLPHIGYSLIKFSKRSIDKRDRCVDRRRAMVGAGRHI
jgi:hypothetical protein